MSAMKRYGGKLTDIFDGAVPCQPVIHVRHHAQIHAVNARLIKHVLNDAPFAGRCEENLIHKLLAGVLEKRFEIPHHVARSRSKPRVIARGIDKSLEGIAEMPNALKVMTKGMRLRAGPYD